MSIRSEWPNHSKNIKKKWKTFNSITETNEENKATTFEGWGTKISRNGSSNTKFDA